MRSETFCGFWFDACQAFPFEQYVSGFGISEFRIGLWSVKNMKYEDYSN